MPTIRESIDQMHIDLFTRRLASVPCIKDDYNIMLAVGFLVNKCQTKSSTSFCPYFTRCFLNSYMYVCM